MYKKLLPVLFVLSMFLLGIGMTAFGQEAHEATFVAQEDVSLTISRAGAAIVRDTKRFDFAAGLNHIVIAGFDPNVDLNSLTLSSAEQNGTYAIRQSLEETVLNRNELLNQSIGQEITLMKSDGSEITGTLLSRYSDEMLLQTGENEYTTVFLSDFRQIRYPQNLQIGTAQTLLNLWVYSPQAGEQSISLSYLVYNIGWNIEYNLLLGDDDTLIDINAWLTITNYNSTSFENAKVTLIAGNADELQLVSAQRNVVPTVESLPAVQATATAIAYAFATPTSLALPETGGGGCCGYYYDTNEVYQEYHLPEPVSLSANSETRLEYLAEATIQSENRFVYDASPRVYGYSGFITNPTYGVSTSNIVQNFLEITSDLDLPGGQLRLYRESETGATRQVGESRINYTPANEHLQIFLTQTDEVTGERRQLDFQQLSQDAVQETYEIRLRNGTSQTVTVLVPERMSRSANWEILLSNVPYEQANAFGIEYTVEVPAGETLNINYTVLYTRP